MNELEYQVELEKLFGNCDKCKDASKLNEFKNYNPFESIKKAVVNIACISYQTGIIGQIKNEAVQDVGEKIALGSV